MQDAIALGGKERRISGWLILVNLLVVGYQITCHAKALHKATGSTVSSASSNVKPN